jgi:uncharacterized membrane protein YphA (DoxX/SURF4 family)
VTRDTATPDSAVETARSPRAWLPWLGTAARIVLGAVFVVAGALKVGDLAESGRAVNAYQILPFSIAKVLGYTLPFVEIAVGLLLIVGLATRLAAILAGLMLIAYIAAISSVWARGLSIDCGCFSRGGSLTAGARPSYGWDIARDVGLAALAAFLAFAPRTKFSVDDYLLGPMDERTFDDD